MTASRRAIAHLHAAAREAGITHPYLHGWAVEHGHNSITDMNDDALDDMARRIKDDPEIMAAWFDAFAPIDWEPMAVDENAPDGDPSVLSDLFTKEQWADLNAQADDVQRKYQWSR